MQAHGGKKNKQETVEASKNKSDMHYVTPVRWDSGTLQMQHPGTSTGKHANLNTFKMHKQKDSVFFLPAEPINPSDNYE